MYLGLFCFDRESTEFETTSMPFFENLQTEVNDRGDWVMRVVKSWLR